MKRLLLARHRSGALRHIAASSLGILIAGCAATQVFAGAEAMQEFTVIAHRGASGYLPEHTLAGAAMAHGMGADYIELDVVLTRDDQLVVLHDLYLDAVTDAAARFPDRGRPDGRRYAIDFMLDEIRTLTVGERLGRDRRATFPDRFPAGERIFRVPTLDEEIRLIQGLNRSTGREVGIYLEPKAPAWHSREGKDLVAAVLDRLAAHGYRTAADKVLLQSFDMEALRRAREELGSSLRMVQLIGENRWRESAADFEYLQTEEGLARIAQYAQGIGPWLPQVVEVTSSGALEVPELVRRAHAAGLFVHAYTLRVDQLPDGAGSFDDVVRFLSARVGLDGVFTDHPDRVIAALHGYRAPSRGE
jgi:glycerophosphoryl diester phosphodiesterase